MNKQQKRILIEFTSVIIITVVAVAAMINFKDWVNRSEAMRAMEGLGEIVRGYHQKRGAVPPESYVETIKENLEGHARLGKLHYRARWIELESSPEEILAYTEKKYHSSLRRVPILRWILQAGPSDGYIVLRLNGQVEWMAEQEFETLLAQQQSQMEIEPPAFLRKQEGGQQ